MRSLAILCLLSAAPAAAATSAEQQQQQRPPRTSPAARETVAQGNAAFGVELYRKLSKEDGNVFISPISVAGAFGPVAAGARGETRTAIDTAMRFPEGPALHPALGRMLKELERKSEGVTLSIANALWVKKELALKPAFQRIARESYEAQVEAVDFQRAPKAAETRINDWVAKETRGRIKGIVSADNFDRYTRLVITNAAYFLGDWADPFPVSQTKEQSFHGSGGERQIPLMHKQGSFRYFETESFQAIDLPYRDPKLSMSVFLPKTRDGLGRFEEQLSDVKLREWLRQLDEGTSPQPVLLHLPKLKVAETYDLNAPLVEMGMGIAFTDRADLRGIADEDMMISQVVQKTFLRMDEKGTEAAAVTGVTIVVTSAPPRPVTFRADHPFFLVIREKSKGAILFMGRIVAPDPG